MGSEPQSGPNGQDEVFSLVRELDALKRRGSNLLVVGSDLPSSHAAVCRDFLGDDASRTRRRLFVVTDSSTPVADRLPELAGAPGADRVRTIRYDVEDRSASAATGNGSISPRISETRVTAGELDSLGCAVSEAIAAFDEHGDGLDPAELRVCFDSLTPLITAKDRERERTFRFLHLLTARIRSVRGMGHFHLPGSRTSEHVRLLEPLFDATVELVLRDGSLHQRWHLHDADLTTEWLPA